MIHFEIPKCQSSIIKVIGVGGGGSNAVNYMHSLGIDGVDFVVCNTDSQALSLSPVSNKIQLGPHLTKGLGAGANPNIGQQACEESIDEILNILESNTRMVFLTAGMGGGTGTGAAPVIAKLCRDIGVLTVGIVTTPFSYEGRKRKKQAMNGIERMKKYVDTMIIISNDNLRLQYGNLPFTKAFEKADNILAIAAKCITDVINTTGQINVDFADVCTVMRNGEDAIIGNAEKSGANRALEAIEDALYSPLLNNNNIKDSKWILLNITSSEGEFEHSMDEVEAIQSYIQEHTCKECEIILGMGHDAMLRNKISVTVIATTQFEQIDNNVNQDANNQFNKHEIMFSNQNTESRILVDLGLKDQITTETNEMTKEDIEERRIFEEQKRALEERAERLRRMSFDTSTQESEDEIENVPAYIRKNIIIDNGMQPSIHNFYSPYTVGKQDGHVKAEIQSINTFLQGKKPD